MSWRNDRHDMINWTTKRGRWKWVTPIRSDLRAWLYQLPNVSLSDSGMYLLMMKEFGPTHEVFIEKPWKHVSKIRSLYANWPSWPLLFFFVAQKFRKSHLQRHVSKAQLPHIKKNIFFKLCINIANSSPTSLPFPRLWRFQWILAKARNQRTDTKDQKVNHGWLLGGSSQLSGEEQWLVFVPRNPEGFSPSKWPFIPLGHLKGTKGYALFSKPSRKEALCRGIFLVTWCRLKP